MTIEKTIAELKSLLGDRLTTSPSDRDLHGRSEAHFADAPPDAVAYPLNTEEVSNIAKICHANNCPMIPWGAGTSLEGHALAVRGGVTLDFSRMDKVLEVHAEDMDVVIQPGVRREELNVELRATGLFFPVDPGANATLGGMASTGASGTTALRYGTMRENVLALEVVLADGRIIRTGTRAKKSSSGYDLTHLFVGAEGTLGIITELTVRLQGQPEAISAAICAFDDMEAAVNTVIMTIQMGIPMARMEFVCAETARSFNLYADAGMAQKPHLLLEFHGSPEGVKEQAQRLAEIVEDMGGSDFKWSDKAEERTALWKLRHNGAYAAMTLKPGCIMMATDICVPISRLAEAVTETAEDIAKSSIPGPLLGHVGDGNFHSTLLIDPASPEEMAEAQALAHRMAQRALRMGGTVTGEHGVGFGKMKYMQEEHGDAWQVMGDIKRTFDPTNIMNPGKVVQIN